MKLSNFVWVALCHGAAAVTSLQHITTATLDARAMCNDNCARAVIGSRLGSAGVAQRSADCSSALSTSTTTTVTTITSTTTTAVTTSLSTSISTGTVIVTSTVTIAPVSTLTIPFGKRAASMMPAYASACSAPGAYASACSCIGVMSTTRTSVVTSTGTATSTATSTTVVVTTIPTTLSTTTVTSTTSTSTSTTSVLSCPTATGTVSGFPAVVYQVYYQGSGFTENPVNPGNSDPTGHPPVTTTIDGTLTRCQAITQCANIAAQSPGEYFSIDLHFSTTTMNYQCIAYYNQNSDPSYFNVATPGVSFVVGFSAISNS